MEFKILFPYGWCVREHKYKIKFEKEVQHKGFKTFGDMTEILTSNVKLCIQRMCCDYFKHGPNLWTTYFIQELKEKSNYFYFLGTKDWTHGYIYSHVLNFLFWDRVPLSHQVPRLAQTCYPTASASKRAGMIGTDHQAQLNRHCVRALNIEPKALCILSKCYFWVRSPDPHKLLD